MARGLGFRGWGRRTFVAFLLLLIGLRALNANHFEGFVILSRPSELAHFALGEFGVWKSLLTSLTGNLHLRFFLFRFPASPGNACTCLRVTTKNTPMHQQ